MKKKNTEQVSLVNSFKTRAVRAGGYSMAATAVILAIVVVINLLVGALPARMTKFDITDNRVYSISDQTKATVQGLKQDVTVYWILTEGNEDSYIRSLLDLMQEYSSHIKIVRKDTDADPRFAEAYTNPGDTVYGNSLIVECGERYRFLNYSGDIYTYDYADYYTTGTYTTYFNGEGALVSAFDYVTNPELPKAYFLTGHGETELATNFAAAVKSQNIESASLTLLTEEAVPADADVVVICNPTKDIAATELDKLRTYTSVGGNIMLLSDLYSSTTTLPNLETLMGEYGMSAIRGTVVEGSRTNYLEYQVNLLPTMQSHAITDPLINGNYFVLLAGAHGIQVADSPASDLSITELMITSSSSYAKQGSNSNTQKEAGDLDGPFATAVLSTRNEGDTNASSVIWVSSPTLINEDVNDYVSGGNMDMFLNMLGYLADPEAIEMTIHAKPLSSTKYLVMGNNAALALKLLVVAIIPLGYLGVGTMIWYRRKKQ